ncbi:CDP-diacylglycerol--serine O-phosphatidyltransferase [Anaerosinus massiliensis]|uniref:CDP-diacylglycerol--serine O-phosphatidyltransferase n=1 Tax=Massilibacillus massiliensis TaxID=1806837 RepID=UPI000A6A8866|nr:CDP-diacylglycerol--serine O-phosphatidyltransferase [Massilibacillus massiliensis]
MRSLIPNMLTSLNLVFGMGAIIATIQKNFFVAALFIVLAMVADGLDGRVARFFNASSEFGKELDSLCDLVSFGVAPAILAYSFLLKDFGVLGYFAAVMFATCGALRLARFNVNTSVVKGYFMGLPIPAGGCFLATFIMLGIEPNGFIFPVMVMVIGYLMVSTVRYPDFKGKGEKIRQIPILITILLAIAVIYTVIQLGNIWGALFIPFIAYTILGISNTFFALFDKKL